MNDELPEGWKSAKLGAIATKVGSGATPRGGSAAYEVAGVPLIRSQNVYFSAFRDEGLVFLNKEQAAALDGVRVQVRDVLLNITGASIGRACVAPERMRDSRVNQHVAIIRPVPESIDPMILAMYLESPAIQTRINTEEYGVTRQALTKGWIEELDVPVAPLAEQRRIVEKVEALLEQVNRAKERLERVPLILKRFRQAVLAAACSGELTREWREVHPYSANARVVAPDEDLPALPELPEEWSLVPLVEAVERFQYGTSDKADAREGQGVPVLRMGNIQDGRLDLSDLKFMTRSRGLDGFLVRRGDVLFNRTNSPELVGKTAIVNVDEAMVFASYLIRAQVKASIVRPEFVSWWLNSAWGRLWARHVRADGVSQSNINSTKLAAMPLPLPGLYEQDEALRLGRRLLGLADGIEERVRSAGLRAQKLPQAILSKAFSGEMVPTEAEIARAQGRSYETAAALLERLGTGHGVGSGRSNGASRGQQRRAVGGRG